MSSLPHEPGRPGGAFDPAPPASDRHPGESGGAGSPPVEAEADSSDAPTTARLTELVYGELRALADAYLRRERADHTLQPTALVNEAWMRLADQQRFEWQGHSHFLAIAAVAMRRVLVDHARAHKREKRGFGAERESLPAGLCLDPGGLEVGVDVLALNEGLEALKQYSPRAARVVDLRFFAGLSEEETASVLGIARATAKRDWRVARAWLSDWLRRGGRA